MGFKGYFKAGKPKPAAGAAAAPAASLPPITEKVPATHARSSTYGTPRNMSSRASIAPSTRSSAFVDDIKHEVMCNFVYQQQCSHLWVSDGSGELEGVLLKKSKHEYISCPPQLATSPFAGACMALGAQVSSGHSAAMSETCADITVERHDRQLEDHQDLPGMVTRRRRRSLDERPPCSDSTIN